MYLLQFGAQAGAQPADISNDCRETTAVYAARHKYPQYPQLVVNPLHTGSVSSVMFGRVQNSLILVS